ncbi:MAG: hypothetical protein J6K04_13045 [Lachnospiraceae bacterium]|nr:hypothetical protein [Lachnospiraceae bacterium]
MEKKSSLRFTGRRHSRKGVISTVIAGIAWGIFIALCVCSAIARGLAEVVVGAIGMVDAVFALSGMIIAIKGFQEREVYYVLPTVGVVLNGILFVIYFSLYFMGVAIA